MISLRNKKWLIWVLVLLIFTLFIFVFYLLKESSSSSLKKEGLGEVIREDLIQRVTIAGMVTPARKTIITAPYSGYVKKIFVKIGDKVKQGDSLVSITQSLQTEDNVYPIRAPFNGVIVQINKREGEFVRELETSEFILRIDDFDKFYIDANASEIDRVKIKSNQEAIIKISAILNKTYKGVLRDLSLSAKSKGDWGGQSVEFPIKIEITNKDEMIKPGMSALVDVITDKKEKVLTLRLEYIRREKNQYFVILKNGKRQDIQVGLLNEEAIEILEGLKEGDLVKQIDFTQMETTN